MAGLEKGKLAIIIGAHTEFGKQYIGRVVTLDSFLKPGESVIIEQGLRHRFFSTQFLYTWLVSGDDITAQSGCKGFILVDVKYLMPLEGDTDQFIKENEKELEKV